VCGAVRVLRMRNLIQFNCEPSATKRDDNCNDATKTPVHSSKSEIRKSIMQRTAERREYRLFGLFALIRLSPSLPRRAVESWHKHMPEMDALHMPSVSGMKRSQPLLRRCLNKTIYSWPRGAIRIVPSLNRESAFLNKHVALPLSRRRWKGLSAKKELADGIGLL
jgi:hypothetical protein